MPYATITTRRSHRACTGSTRQAVPARASTQHLQPGRQCLPVAASRQDSPQVGGRMPDNAHEQRLITLMKRLVTGDRKAFTALYDTTSGLVYGIALGILRDPTAAEEVAIEVYMQVYQQATHYDYRRGTPSAWLQILTRSRAIDRRRQDALRRQREASPDVVVLSSFSPGPEAYNTALEQHRVLQKALTTLNSHQRQVIEMAYFEGLSHSEIAARLGQPLGTVKTRVRTGLRCLREALTT
jgi:RNA polymerase sigma-70 factor (ECF subfamily)